MNTVMAFNEGRFNEQVSNYNSFNTQLQQVVDSYEKMGYGTVTNEVFHRIFTDLEALIFDGMTKGKPLSIAGIEIHKEKALELIKKPTGYEPLKELADKVKAFLSDGRFVTPGNHPIACANICHTYHINEKGKVELKPATIERLREQNTINAISDNAKKLFDFANAILAKSKELNLDNIIKSEPNGLGYIVDAIIERGHYGSSTLSLNAEAIAKWNQPGFIKF